VVWIVVDRSGSRTPFVPMVQAAMDAARLMIPREWDNQVAVDKPPL
jgi:hypothetical protein